MVAVRRCLGTVASALPDLDKCFYRLGRQVGLHPLVAMSFSILLLAGMSFGLLAWQEEVDLVKLFLPHNSPVRADALWVDSNFKDDVIFASVIVEADNVLAKPVITAIMDMEMAVRRINVSNHDWGDVCARYLSWFKEKIPESIKDDFEDAKERGVYLDECVYQSLLKIWTNNGSLEQIPYLKQDNIFDDITKAINDKKQKNILDEIKPLMSQISHDSNMRATGAKATILNWMLKRAVEDTPEWELEFLQATMFPNKTLPPSMKIYAVTDRSYYDALHEVLKNNIPTMLAGFAVIIIYVAVMVSQCSIIRMRLYISLVAVSLVGQAIMSSYGFCFYMGFYWGPIHPILPFLLLGVGIDNTFVMVQCLDSVDKEQQVTDVPERIGRTLQKCGVSITVTCLTDILAFAVGTTSAMPFLRSFCVFAATGVMFLYIFGFLFFLSCLTLDEYRIQEKRDGCCFRVKNDDRHPQRCEAHRHAKSFIFRHVAPVLTKLPCKIIICIIAVTFFAINIWNVFQVEQKFDPMLYLSPSAYPLKYSSKLNQYFPDFGKRAGIYLGNINYFKEEENLYKLLNLLKNDPFINGETVDFWYPVFQEWLYERYRGVTIEDEEDMKAYLSEFLLITKQGQSYVKDMKLNQVPFGNFTILASKINIQHVQMNTTFEKVSAMASIADIIKQVNFTSSDKIVAFSPDYVTWTANKIITDELIRNLAITVGAVAAVTMLLIRDLRTSVFVIVCVVLTVTDLVGVMHWMGLTIEIFTSVMVLLCTGLAVDYAAHIGYEFTRLRGTRDERAIESLNVIGAAVFHGGFSTFLAFSLLGFSDSYLLTTSFKLFTGVVVFGMYHGLAFLPVILSCWGPSAPEDSHFEVNCVALNNAKCTDNGLLNSCFKENDVHFKPGDTGTMVMAFPLPSQAHFAQNGTHILDRSASAPCLQTD